VSDLVEHIGILVDDLEAAIDRWSRATGYTFSPIVRYRTDRWVDSSDPAPHPHDARIAFSLEGPPRIELMEVTGFGALGSSERGVHHFGFAGVDIAGRVDALEAQGVGHDGHALDAQDRMLVCFTDKHALDGVRLELVSPLPNPIVADDGSELPRDARTGRVDVWAGTPHAKTP
jgi:catechol 2,3-dioxygenase-like lactoylglutathione lyase family enzyme